MRTTTADQTNNVFKKCNGKAPNTRNGLKRSLRSKTRSWVLTADHPQHPDKGLTQDEYFTPSRYRDGVFIEKVHHYNDIFGS